MHECKTVTLRTRPLKKNMLSFYLDYYPGYRDKESMKVIRHESLGIYIYADPKNQREQNFNAVMSEKAEAIRCRRFESIVNERYDFFDKSKMKGDFLAYYKKTLRKHDQKWEFVYLHFCNFVGGKCSFEEIDVDLCNKFREYLLNAKQLRRPERPISRNSAVGYWSTFRGFLKILYRNKLIHSNVNDFLEKIEPEDAYCYGNRELAHGIAKGFHDRIALACDIPSYDEEAAHIMYAEIDKQLKILKDFANDIQQHGPKIIWHGDTPDEHHEEQDFFVDNNNALSVSGLADNTLKLMNYILKTVLPAEQTSGESISLGEKLYAMEHNGISYGGQLKNYEGLTSIEAILEHPVNSVCFCWDDKWKFIISDSEGHTLEEFYYSSYEETLQAINACTGIPDSSAPVEWLTPSHVCLTQADAKPIQVKWMRTIKELNKFLGAHPGNSVYEVTLCGYYEDFPCIENYNIHGTVHNCILYYDDTVAEIFLKACFHSAEYFIIYGRQDKLAAAETTKCLAALLGIHMDIDICDDDEIDEDENTFESVRTEFQTMSRYLDIYQQWGAGVPITALIEKYQTDEENIANAITACEDRYLKPILGDFMLEEGSSKRIAEMIKKYVPKFTF